MRVLTKLIGIMTLSFISCKKFVQIGAPQTLLVTKNVFSNSATATAALTSIYTQMFQNTESYNLAEDLGLLCDELTNYSTQSIQLQFYTNSMTAINSNGEWNNAYNYIYQANAIISALQGNGNISPAVAQQLTGEAKFIRAFWHFYLTNEYGGVPLVTSTLYTINERIPRTAQAQVYAQIIEDLQDAQVLLNANYVDGSDTSITIERTRPTKAVAEAMLARVYLYTGKYDSADDEATLVINNSSQYSLDSNLSTFSGLPNAGPNSVFSINNSEAIWQLATPPQAGYNTDDANNFNLDNAAPGTNGNSSSTISPELLSSFEPGDLRRLNWIDSVVLPGVTYYFPFKYQQSSNNNPSNNPIEYETVLRLAEQFLIRAEAEANLSDMTDAATDLNIVRRRAGLPPSAILTASSTIQQAVSAILNERRAEFFTEWGHRWFDLIRTGTVNSVMGSPGNVCRLKGGVWSPNSYLFPIPQGEILLDPSLTQNSGYGN